MEWWELHPKALISWKTWARTISYMITWASCRLGHKCNSWTAARCGEGDVWGQLGGEVKVLGKALGKSRANLLQINKYLGFYCNIHNILYLPSHTTVLFKRLGACPALSQTALGCLTFVRKDNLQKEVVTKLLDKTEVKTWKGSEDARSLRGTCWSKVAKWATAAGRRCVSHTEHVVKKNSYSRNTEATNVPKQVLWLTSHMICVPGSCHLIPFARQVVYLPSQINTDPRHALAPDSTLQGSIFLKRLMVFKKEIADG